MKRYFQLLFCLFLWSGLCAQNIYPVPFEYKSDTALQTVIPHTYWQFMADKSGKLTIDQVASNAFNNRFRDSLQGVDSSSKVYWIRYNLKNGTNSVSYISQDGLWDYTDLYLGDSTGKFRHFVSGTLRPGDQKDGLKDAHVIPDTLKPGEVRFVYLRVRNNSLGMPGQFSIVFFNTDKMVRDAYFKGEWNRNNLHYSSDALLEAFLIGLFLLAIFLNFNFYRIVKEKEYLYFALFALFLGMNRLFIMAISYLSWYHPSWAGLVRYLTFAWAFIPIFLIQFYRYFLNTRKHFPVLDKIAIALAVLSFLKSTYDLIVFTVPERSMPLAYVRYTFIIYFVIPLFLLLLLLLSLSKQKKNASIKLIVIGSAPYLLHQVISGVSFTIFFTSSSVKYIRLIEAATITWLTIFLTLTLLKRFILLRQEVTNKSLENEKLAREKEVQKVELMEQQKIELEKKVEERTNELQQSLKNLKAAQSQLILSEKMASLGELTAGIAHEIQNPLNFVNNFSEINKELTDELKAEIAAGNWQSANEIIADIKGNSDKINFHGKRADAIVKGMLQHSRGTSGQKEMTDINSLCDEYLRLSYHGLRAKDKSFNAKFEAHLDETNPMINVVPQDIGRVILNLLNNAFYAVNERKKAGEPGYAPEVIIETRNIGHVVNISVKDNGNGMSPEVLKKVFQPFFTTKPTGKGTGLGLSLVYDIVKAHNGELKVNSESGVGSEFVIQLPLN